MSFNKHSTSDGFRQYFDHGAYPSAWQAALPVGSSSDWSRVKARGCTLGFFGFWNNFVWRTWDVENWSVNLGQGIGGTVDWAQKIWKKSTLLLQTQKLRSHQRWLNLRKLYVKVQRADLTCDVIKKLAPLVLSKLWILVPDWSMHWSRDTFLIKLRL